MMIIRTKSLYLICSGQSFSLIARFPVLIANSYASKRHYFDNQSLILHNPVPEYSTAQNFLHLIRADNKFTELEAEILDLALMLQAEHGGGNNSAFTVHVLSSTGTDTYSAISAAVGSLKGPKHGGANDKMMSQMNEIKANVKNWEDKDEIYEYLKKILQQRSRGRKRTYIRYWSCGLHYFRPKSHNTKRKSRIFSRTNRSL